MASNQEEAVRRAIRESGGKKDTESVRYAYNQYVESMARAKQKPKPLSSF